MFNIHFIRVVILLFSCGHVKGKNVTVDTKYGKVQGHVVTLGTGETVVSYLGIPFAKPPVGSLRFKAPEEPERWVETFVGDQLGNICPQITTSNYSEDCLHMNIFTPHNYSTPGPYPVYVYLHGGGYRLGSNSGPTFGHFYASRGVVFVAPNYRLGNLGFMYSGDHASRGNFGLLDQRQALLFVRENIERFDGDPGRVTLGGLSAGARCVGLHLVSPMSQGLFHQAIAISGSDLGTMSVNSPNMTVNFTHQVAQQLSCPTEDNQRMVECLRTKTAKEIVDVNINMYPGVMLPSMSMSPTIDGAGGFLPDMPIELRRKGQFVKLPLLVGTTDKETSIYFGEERDGYNQSVFRENLASAARWELGYYGDSAVGNVTAALIYRYTPWGSPENRSRNRDKRIEMVNDIVYHGPVDHLIRHHSEVNTTYQYVFGYRGAYTGTIIDDWMGVPHAFDVPYFLGWAILDDHPEVAADMQAEPLLFDERDRNYSNYWMNLHANFIKYGNPTPSPHPSPGGHTPTLWLPRTPEEMNYLHVHNDVISVQKEFKQSNAAFWREYVPWVVQQSTKTRGCPSPPPIRSTGVRVIHSSLITMSLLIVTAMVTAWLVLNIFIIKIL